MIKTLKLSEIVTDAGTQVRAGLNEITVADYAEALAGGAKFPAVIVFHDGNRYITADGFHRIHAAIKNGAKVIESDVRKGGKADALKFALGCNAHHGMRRTNADKRNAVRMALEEFPRLSDVAISELCLVGRELVAEIRKLNLSIPAGWLRHRLALVWMGVSGNCPRRRCYDATRMGRMGLMRRMAKEALGGTPKATRETRVLPCRHRRRKCWTARAGRFRRSLSRCGNGRMKSRKC